jgi:hypothetical protein
MQRKFVLVVVLCLVAVAALAIGAAPALATDGCDCHTAVPPIGGAPAAHAPFVAGVSDCTTCHQGWTVPHPKAVEPKLEFMAEAIGNPVTMSGHLAVGQRGLNGVVVYLQQQVSGAGDFTDLAQVVTVRPPLGAAGAFFVGAGASDAKGTRYRAISQGVAGKTVVMPALAETGLRPSVDISEMRGLGPNEQLRLGRSVVAFGHAAPSWLAGEKVRFALEKKTRRGQRVQARAQRVIADDSTISWRVTPGTRGRFIVTVRLAATADHPRASGASWWFTVR